MAAFGEFMKRFILSLLMLLCMTGWLRAQELVDQPMEPETEPVIEMPAEEETVSPEPDPTVPVDEPATEVPVDNEPAVDPVIEAPIDEPVKPKRPSRPVVDPDLRNMYLRNTAIGSGIGPRALKRPSRSRPERAWRSELEVGATGYRGNNDSEFLLLKLKTEKKEDNNSLRFSARGTLGNKDGERDRENGEVEAAMRRQIENRWYYTAEARYFTDKIADVDYQVVSILSPGYEFIRSDDAHLSVELGPAYIAEKKGDEEKDFAAIRLAILMDKLIDERILLWERFEYLPAIEDTDVYLVIAEVGVESILTNWFSLRTVLQQRYDSNPADDKEKQDIFISVSLVTAF